MADIRREEIRDEGLTTATLANLEERETSNLDRDYDRQVMETEPQRGRQQRPQHGGVCFQCVRVETRQPKPGK